MIEDEKCVEKKIIEKDGLKLLCCNRALKYNYSAGYKEIATRYNKNKI